jgi:Beta-lactamase enzyme family
MKELIIETVDKIEHLIIQQLPESKYQFELYDLTTHTKHFRGNNEHFHWGSVYKLFLVAEIIKMSEEGLIKMDTEMNLQRDKFLNGNGVFKNLKDLKAITFCDACRMVLCTSDNVCADGLLEVVGFQRINRLFKDAGCSNSMLSDNLNTMVMDLIVNLPKNSKSNYFHSMMFFEHFNSALNTLLKRNYSTASNTNSLFKFILNGSYLTENGTAMLKEFILTPSIHTRLAAYTIFGNFQLRGKTGAIGYDIVNNEVVAIINKKTLEILGFFSLFTKDIVKRKFLSNDTLGLIGLEIVNLYEQLFEEH